MHKILLIGAGQIGNRHLQGLLKIGLPVSIDIVDPSIENRKLAAERAGQIETNRNVKQLRFLESLNNIEYDKADLAIIATNSDVRAEVVSKLIDRVRVQNFILEKIAFQSTTIFKQQLSLLEEHSVKAWVNCPRRIYPFYLSLRERLYGKGKISVIVSGGNWGLGCNSLHFIDLFTFLTGNQEIASDYVSLDHEILQSKRAGFVEFTGRMGFSNKGGDLHLGSFNEASLPVLIEVISNEGRWLISEANSIVISFTEESRFYPEIATIRFPFQSELTNLVAEEIIKTGNSGLTDIGESFLQHNVILPLFNDQLFAANGIRNENCPIT
jgi:hypothetical protein